jgi:hypothetical protein
MVENCLLYTSFPPKKFRFSHLAMSVLTTETMIMTMKMMVSIIIITYVNVITQNHYLHKRRIKSKILPDIFGHINRILLSFCPSV